MTPRRRTSGAQSTVTATYIRRHRPDYQIMLFMGLLVLIGLVVLFAISPYQINHINAEGGNLDQTHYMLKQLIYLGVGIAGFTIMSLVPFDWWRRWAGKIVMAGIGLCLLLALLGAVGAPLALCHNGACRWYSLGPAGFQPAELLKFGVLVFMAAFLARRMAKREIDDPSATLLPVGLLLGVCGLLVIGVQKDMGTGITLLGMVLAMLVMTGLSMRRLAAGIGAIGAAGLLFIVFSPHRMERVMTFFGSGSTSTDYHIEMATIAIGSGGVLGRGLGQATQVFGYLPEALNDSIFAVLGETFGLVGLLVIMVLFVALLRRVIRTMTHVQDPMMQLLAAGVFGWIATHVLVNIGAMIGILPLTGVTLPFLSFGGTSLFFIMAALGVVYHVSRYTTHQLVTTGGNDEASRSRRGIGRSRDTRTRRYQRA